MADLWCRTWYFHTSILHLMLIECQFVEPPLAWVSRVGVNTANKLVRIKWTGPRPPVSKLILNAIYQMWKLRWSKLCLICFCHSWKLSYMCHVNRWNHSFIGYMLGLTCERLAAVLAFTPRTKHIFKMHMAVFWWMVWIFTLVNSKC